ncbi:hypothetical protein [Oribacterium sp. NK2B42]|uniref:hypothetical protein n=1 Tax=Oribacterium sp. NK2B42 TaxID=689781 RepID=UPI000492BA2C|nr:hypothetical protein [Oribacterium sp. NK2B42]
MAKVTLNKVATEAANDICDACNDIDSIKKQMLRKFDDFLFLCGGSKDHFMNAKGNYEIDETEVAGLKFLLIKLYYQDGILSKFADKRHPDESVSLSEVSEMFEALDKYLVDTGYTEDEVGAFMSMLDRITEYGYRCMFDYIHEYVDMLEFNLRSYPYTYQIMHAQDLMMKMKSLFLKYTTDSIQDIVKLVELSEVFGTYERPTEELDGHVLNYGNSEVDEIDKEYIERDARVRDMFIKDPDLRNYIEKKLGRPLGEYWTSPLSEEEG